MTDVHDIQARATALNVLESLARLNGDSGDLWHIRKMRESGERRTAALMSEILDKLPVKSVSARARLLGVARPSYYSWLRGTTRPSLEMARKISKLTKVDVDVIRGVSSANGAPD